MLSVTLLVMLSVRLLLTLSSALVAFAVILFTLFVTLSTDALALETVLNQPTGEMSERTTVIDIA